MIIRRNHWSENPTKPLKTRATQICPQNPNCVLKHQEYEKKLNKEIDRYVGNIGLSLRAQVEVYLITALCRLLRKKSAHCSPLSLSSVLESCNHFKELNPNTRHQIRPSKSCSEADPGL